MVALGLYLVVVLFTLQMHEVEFVDQAQLLKELDCAINSGAVDVRLPPAGKFDQRAGIEMLLCFLNGLAKRRALRGQTNTSGTWFSE